MEIWAYTLTQKIHRPQILPELHTPIVFYLRYSILGKNAGGFLKRKAKLEIEARGKSPLRGKAFGRISYEWAFMIFKAEYKEQEGVPIVRTMCQLAAIEEAIYQGLEPGVRNPEGFLGRLGKKEWPKGIGMALN